MGEVDDEVLELAKGPNFASFTTMMPDGRPVASLMWIDAQPDLLLVNTERHRTKYQNVCRNPRVHLLILDGEDMGHYASVQGRVEDHIFGHAARTHIDELAHKYLGTAFDATRIVSERVILRIRPLRQRVRHSSVIVE